MSSDSSWAPSSQSQAQLDPKGRERVLKRVLARHVTTMRGGGRFSSGFHLVYVGADGDPKVGDMPLKMNEWLTAARGDIDGQLEELAEVLSKEQVVCLLADTIAHGFVGLILAINAGYRPDGARHLIDVRQEMIVASLVTLDEQVSSARFLLADNAIEFIGDEEGMPWDAASLKQLLFLLDDAIGIHMQQEDVAFVTPRVLVIKDSAPPERMLLPDQARQAFEKPRVNL